MRVDEASVTVALREAGARFAFVHGSRAFDSELRGDSDLDVGAWWAQDPPPAWEVRLPGYVDLVVLNAAPPNRLVGRGRRPADESRTWLIPNG